MIGSKKKKAEVLRAKELEPAPAAPPVINIQWPPVAIMQEIEYRPVWVQGRKGLFHRWINTAKPAQPRGSEPDENTRYFQYRATKALVEFENGAMETVWPQDMVFADRGRFQDYAWDPMEQQEETTW